MPTTAMRIIANITAYSTAVAPPSSRSKRSRFIRHPPGRGKTPDYEITGALTLNLRAERLGDSTDRIYTITVKCTDNSGNAATRTVSVIVPHDRGNLGMSVKR